MKKEGTVSESIFSGVTKVIPMADVQHIEKIYDDQKEKDKTRYRGILIITKHTTWNFEKGYWANGIYLDREEAEKFIMSWCFYRYELESSTLIKF